MNKEPAFPVSFGMMGTGMTLRDYFAAKAMQSLIEKTELMMQAVLEDASHHGDSDFILQKHREDICSSAYAYADQMLLERNETSGD